MNISTVCTKENNHVYLIGTLASSFTYSHKNHDREFWKATLNVKRLSGFEDSVPIVVDRSHLETISVHEGMTLKVHGILRTHFKLAKYKSLELYVLAYALSIVPDDTKHINEVYLRAKMSKYSKPVLRFTPFGRQIASFTLQQENKNCDHTFNFSCIAWGSCARRISQIAPETIVTIEGRFQSRIYEKQISEKVAIPIQTHEISINGFRNIT